MDASTKNQQRLADQSGNDLLNGQVGGDTITGGHGINRMHGDDSEIGGMFAHMINGIDTA